MGVAELMWKEGERRGLRKRTIQTYIFCVNKFLRLSRKNSNEVTKYDVDAYLHNLIKWNRAGSTLNVNINAIKFYFEKVLNKKLTVNIDFVNVPKKLPDFLSQEDVKKLFPSIKNSKHQLMIKLLYATGMRVSELVSLKIKDFEFNNNYGWVRDGKGGKDRIFIVAEKLKLELQRWIRDHNLNKNDWIFSGIYGNHISDSSIRKILITAAKRANIKEVHPHMLRHSFATHLIENGYAVTEVQPLLGHTSIDTTMVYLHMASPQLIKVQSPFDAL
ncbi:tyrosine-type recombinase/integrase [Candidatus Woesearchaeota archaeon]|nr:tyrosine-type recombinase/integrase [Candidatus Woesearchaeota archaeon]